jgi:2-polyprenyl-3-methyl-5-hydroxy-6-metoxy-1,4-benzoquinol methylase
VEDIRIKLYDHYVSKFKTNQNQRDERHVRAYSSWCRFKYLPILREINHDDPILELGCGPGYFLEFLTSQGFTNSHGIDISKEQIELAASRGLSANVADVFKFLSNQQERYAAIVALDFIEHFTKQELITLFPLINKNLRKNGVFLVQTPNGQGLFPGQVIYGDLTHSTIFSEDSLSHILCFTGFKNIHFSETGPAPDNLEGKVRTVLWKIIRAIIRIIRQIEAKNCSKLWTESFICWCSK